uniref:Putative lipase-like PAD4 n=1 Tax=Davidia involucrata TaxID=16924 RepID=A0A5B7B1P6_DAVIN
MEAEASSFETSEMLATFLASTPLLLESWKLCSLANATAQQSFVVNPIGKVTYVAFSGVQMVSGLEPSCRNLVPLVHSAANGVLFPALDRHSEGEEPVMVHAGLLHLFLSVFNTPNFENQMFEASKKSKSIVFTGHSIGGTIASLSALWLLCNHQSIPTEPLSVLCITFGSPLLGNESLSRAIVQERWGGNFWHVVAKNDIVPRLLLAPQAPITPQLLHYLFQFWHLSMTSPYLRELAAADLPENVKSDLFHFVLSYVGEMAKPKPGGGEGSAAARSLFWPFGNYMFCTDEGAVCVDNAMAVLKLQHLMFAMGSASSSIEDHLKYEHYVGKVSQQVLLQIRRGHIQIQGDELPESSYEAGIALALQSSGISSSHEPISGPAKDCLKMAKRMGRTPNLNSANLAIGLSKITPLRAQIEWYKALCDECDDQMGYYDTFKLRGASRRDSKVNMNRIKLAQFWNDLIQMLESNQLPHDFHKREKWVNASQFYKLLVEPLDIAEYYRSGVHRTKGHYFKHGRERRYEIFDRWWRDRSGVSDLEEEDNNNNNNKRSKFASLTQDSCFWAKVEEAREWVDNVRSESDATKLHLLWESIGMFEQYARRMVERKEVSRDVMAKNSSYSMWVQEWSELNVRSSRYHSG